LVAGEISQVIDDLAVKNIKVCGFISDNENTMIGVRRILKTKYSIPTAGDPCHALQLVIKDVTIL